MHIKIIFNEEISVEKGDVLEIKKNKFFSEKERWIGQKYIVKINGVEINATS